MRKTLIVFALLLPLLVFAEESTNKTDEASVFKAEAAKITAGKTGRMDKVLAIHTFVRDAISEVKTQYG